MRHTIYKAYIATQYEKEEEWLNEMAAKGLALISVGLCKYIFEDSEPGAYTCKIELLEHMPSSAKSISYIRFLEDTGAEHIGSIFRWIYIRKKAGEGPFDLYSDIGSKIKYLKRLQIFFFSLLVFELGIGIMNLSIGAFSYNRMNTTNLFLGAILLSIALLCGIAAFKHTQKLRALQREQQIRE